MAFRRPHSPRPTHISGRASSTVVRDAAAPTFKVNVLNLAIGCALAGLVSVAVLAPSPALAAEPANSAASQEYAIPAGRLSDVLAQFAATSGVALSFDPQMLAGLSSNGLQGRYSVREGFDQLLAGSGYQLVSAGSGGYSLHQVMTESGAMTLAPVTVTGSAISSPNELPPTYAGGQVARGGRLGILGNRDMMDMPFTQSSYTAELMKNQQVRSISDVLDNDPTAHGTSPTTGHDSFNIRGFTIGNGQTLFNGMQVALGDQGSIATESFERIEVFKGPNALLNGNPGSSVGGVINLVPKRAGDEPLTQFTADYGSDSQLGGHVDIGRRFGSDNAFGIRFNGVYRDGDTPVDHQSRKTELATLGLDYRGERLRLEADLGQKKIDVQGARRLTRMAAGVPVPNAPDNRKNWFDPAEFNKREVLYGALRGEYDLNEQWTAFAAIGGSILDSTRFNANRTITSVQGDLAAGALAADADLTRYYSRAVEGGFRGQFVTGPVQHQMVLAYTAASIKDQRSLASGAPATPFPSSNIHSPVFGASPKPFVPSFDDVKKSAERENSSFVVADTLSVLDEQVQLTIGTRLQQVKVTNFNLASGAVTSRYDKDAVTPMVGLVVKPWGDVSLYANYIEGLERGPIAPATAANAGEIFAPYTSKQYEVGAKKDFGQFTTTLALYQIARPSAFTDPTTNVFGVDGEQRHRGVDFNVFGEVTKGVRLLGGVAYIDSELTKTQGGVNDGNKGIGAPKWRAVLGTEWDVPSLQGLTLTGRVIRNGSTYLNAANTQRIPHWTRLDIGARYRINKTVSEIAP